MKTTLYRIEGVWPGQLAILSRPRGGDWLEDEIQGWKQAGFGVVVSLLTPNEALELGLVRERELCQTNGIEFIPFPVPDRGVPPSHKAALELARELETKLTFGQKVGIHCRQGIGRSALLSACLLLLSGMDAEESFEQLSASRGCKVPETADQRQWVMEFGEEMLATASKRPPSKR